MDPAACLLISVVRTHAISVRPRERHPWCCPICLCHDGDACVLGAAERAGNALHGAGADSEQPGRFQDTCALRKLVSHLALDRAIYPWAPEPHALRDSALEAGFDALANHCPLELGEGAGHLKNELARRGRRVDGLLVEVEIDATRLEVLDCAQEVDQRTPEPVNRPGHDDVEPPPLGVLEHAVEPR
jgi:hypothetical protein